MYYTTRGVVWLGDRKNAVHLNGWLTALARHLHYKEHAFPLLPTDPMTTGKAFTANRVRSDNQIGNLMLAPCPSPAP